jgi:oligoendopeptidase F
MSKQEMLTTETERKILPENLEIKGWGDLLGYFDELKNRAINSDEELEQWIRDLSELESFLSEETAWRYIKMNIDTTDKALEEAFNFLVTEIDPKAAPYSDMFNRKLVENEWTTALDADKYYTYLRSVQNQIRIFRDENIPLMTDLQQLQQKYGIITGGMFIELNGQKLTMQEGSKLLKDVDRTVREKVYRLLQSKRSEAVEELNELFSKLIKLRNRVGRNAGFANFRDYKFAALDRFDYSVSDCLQFHQAIIEEVTPLLSRMDLERKQKLGVDELKPWDLEVDADGLETLKPFKDEDDLINTTIKCFGKLRPYYGECLKTMREMGHLDLGSRMGKAPGGFNYPLYETGVPFIFMNAVGTVRDLVTMIHEGGHAVHSFLSKDLEICAFKQLPSEVAELASMSMELMTFDHWNVFFKNEADEKRAKKEHLSKVISVLPWVATIDAFQHWLYERPNHTLEERNENWLRISRELGSSVIDRSGLEEDEINLWQKQLHLFEVPFYYVEYGIAQLGAIAMWKQYRESPQLALDNFDKALSMGYTRPIGEIYATAGIEFNFSGQYIKELIDFVWQEYKTLG